ncbi:MAG: hypothetical protein PHP50_05440 [Lachnospiraceae bacterium]|nr:hypothetical protein [Lachnospiraceae bacterium]
MANITSFMVYLGAYLIQYFLIIAVAVVAVLLGIKIRKNKNAKDALLASQMSDTEQTTKTE